MLITLYLISSGHHGWVLAVPWIADIGTLHFAISGPRLFREFWTFSRYTRVMKLTGSASGQQVEISLHKGSRYLLEWRWKRAAGELGTTALSEPGTYREGEGSLLLLSDAGRTRVLARDGPVFAVADPGSSVECNLDGWRLRADA